MNNPWEDFSFSDPLATWWPFIIATLVGIVTTIRSFITGPNCATRRLIPGRVVVLTGGSSGVGMEVAVDLLNRGATVWIGTRYPQVTQQIFEKLVKSKRLKEDCQWAIKRLDLSSLASVRKFAQLIGESKVDVLINNAGIRQDHFSTTDDGVEKHFATNYLGHFLLIHLLLPKLGASEGGRIINTVAHVHDNTSVNLSVINDPRHFSRSASFARSKLALLLITRTLSTAWQGRNVTINAANPGLVRGTRHTAASILNKSFYFRLMAAPTTWLLMKTPQQASQTILYLALDEQLDNVSGRYYSNCSEVECPKAGLDFESGRLLYKQSLHLVGMKSHQAEI